VCVGVTEDNKWQVVIQHIASDLSLKENKPAWKFYRLPVD